MDIPMICRARYYDPLTQQVETFTEQFPNAFTDAEIQQFLEAFIDIPFSWERYAEIFPLEAFICDCVKYDWPRYVAARIVRRGPLFRRMQLLFNDAMQFLQEDIANNGFIPTVPIDSPTYSEELFKEWTNWEDLFLQTKSLDERLEIYKKRYHIDITDVSDIEFDSWMPLTPIDDSIFFD